MIAEIQLARFDGKIDASIDKHAWPLTITARGTNISSDIFVYRVSKSGDPFEGDGFSCVASAIQMYELPAKQGVTLSRVQQIPFYRTAQMTVLCHNAKEANEIWEFVQCDVQRLLDNYNLQTQDQSNQVVVLSSVIPTLSASVDVTDPGSMNVGSWLQLPAGQAVVVQATPPNASYAGSTWIQTDAVTGVALRVYGFSNPVTGGDGNWHSRQVVTTGDLKDIQEFVVAPGT